MSAAPQPHPDEAGTTDVLPTTLALLDARVEADPRHLDLAKDVDGSVLSFLALHGGPATGRAVAAHSGTPSDVNLRLAKDPDEEVRSELARKISWRLSALDDSVPNSVREATFRILERLARDRSSEVRAVLSREIRFLCNLPRHIAHAFARDPDAAISGPILECSPLLSEADLMEIILADESREALAFIARRRPLGADLCDAIVFFLDPAAVAALLANPDANIRKQALEHIAEHAES